MGRAGSMKAEPVKIFAEKASRQPGVVDRRGRNQAGDTEGALQHQGLGHGAGHRTDQVGGAGIVERPFDHEGGDGPLASIPTWKEQGFDVQFTNTRFLLAPRGLNAAQTAYWDGIFSRMVETDEWKADVTKNDLIMDFHSSKQSPERLAGMYRQIKTALIDVGLAKE